MEDPSLPSGGVKVMRRELMRAGCIIGGSALTAGCDLLSTSPSDQDASSRGHQSSTDAKEAPLLAQRVKAGLLPPVAKRLPKRPLTLTPESLGAYGGTWNSATLGPSDTYWPECTIGYDPLFTWDPEWTRPVPNVAESVKVTAGARTFTIRLRAGMKWSDGEPFDADDIVFAYDDVLRNTSLYPAVPQDFISGTEPARLEKLGSHLVRFSFGTPNGLFLQRLCVSAGIMLTTLPAHYLRQFHSDYADDADRLARRHGFRDWLEMFGAKIDRWQNTDLPTLCPWHVTTGYGEGAQVVAVRNPYYWKVDSAGRQLPYLDKVVFAVVQDAEAMLLKAAHGDLDMDSSLHFNSMANKPILARNRTQGNYRFLDIVPAISNELAISLNLAHEDPAMRALFQNKDFRVALSHAIDRDELIKAVFQRKGTPWQVAPRKEADDFFLEELATQYINHDLDKANDLLDGSGYRRRDRQGFRLGPAGDRIAFAVEVATQVNPTWIPGMELVQGYWKKVGVDIQLKTESRSLFYERKAANKHDATVWYGDGGLRDAILDPKWYLPFSTESNWAIPWANWYTSGGKAGAEPPPETRRQLELYDRAKVTPNDRERRDLFRQVLQIAQEQFYVIGTAQRPKSYGIVVDRFKNVPTSMPWAWSYRPPGPTRPEQYYAAT